MTLTKRDLVIQITDELNKLQEKLEKDQPQQPATFKAMPGAKATPGRKRQDHQTVEQRMVFEVVQRTLDGITRALAAGQKVELRNFGVFEVKVRKARIGRNPNSPSTDVPIPARSVVKFKAGKEMRAEVLKLPAAASAKPAGQA
jgi:nucleoid DNA-binding protein